MYNKRLDYEQELQLELRAVQEQIDWCDLKLKAECEADMSPQQKLDLLKKKWAIMTGLKNIAAMYG